MRFIILCLLIAAGGLVQAQDLSPWGAAKVTETSYAPQKVVYDVALSSPEQLDAVLDRVSGLSMVYQADPFDASIVLVLHGQEMSFFDARNFQKHEALMRRAQSLTVGGVIEFRMCQLAAAGMGIQPEHVHGFVEMIPMGDAEIVRLQKEAGYAYMH
ncbi:MAG: DsrE family protein [Burkholderiaceae bacterium]|nr:DsrE family protein [Burkholderiaceae bacterium]